MPKCTSCKGYGETDFLETGRPRPCQTCGGDGYVDLPATTVYRPSPDGIKTIETLCGQIARRDQDVFNLEIELERSQMEVGKLRAMLIERGEAPPFPDRSAGNAMCGAGPVINVPCRHCEGTGTTEVTPPDGGQP